MENEKNAPPSPPPSPSAPWHRQCRFQSFLRQHSNASSHHRNYHSPALRSYHNCAWFYLRRKLGRRITLFHCVSMTMLVVASDDEPRNDQDIETTTMTCFLSDFSAPIISYDYFAYIFATESNTYTQLKASFGKKRKNRFCSSFSSYCCTLHYMDGRDAIKYFCLLCTKAVILAYLKRLGVEMLKILSLKQRIRRGVERLCDDG